MEKYMFVWTRILSGIASSRRFTFAGENDDCNADVHLHLCLGSQTKQRFPGQIMLSKSFGTLETPLKLW